MLIIPNVYMHGTFEKKRFSTGYWLQIMQLVLKIIVSFQNALYLPVV